MISEKQFDAGGAMLNFVEGQPSGVPLILLHELGANWAAHQAMLPALTLGWHVCALDLRGHGKSGRTPGRYRVIDYAQDVIAFIRQYLRAPAAVYGHGFGSLVAIAVAGQATEAVHGLILADPPLFYRQQRVVETRWGEPLRQTYQALAANPSTDELARRLNPELGVGELSGLRARAERLRRVDPDALKAVLEHQHMEGLALGPQLARVACPALIIQGDPGHAAMTTEDDAAFARWHLRQFNRVRLDNVGHNLHADAPDAVIELLETFRREVTGMGVL